MNLDYFFQAEALHGMLSSFNLHWFYHLSRSLEKYTGCSGLRCSTLITRATDHNDLLPTRFAQTPRGPRLLDLNTWRVMVSVLHIITLCVLRSSNLECVYANDARNNDFAIDLQEKQLKNVFVSGNVFSFYLEPKDSYS